MTRMMDGLRVSFFETLVWSMGYDPKSIDLVNNAKFSFLLVYIGHDRVVLGSDYPLMKRQPEHQRGMTASTLCYLTRRRFCLSQQRQSCTRTPTTMSTNLQQEPKIRVTIGVGSSRGEPASE